MHPCYISNDSSPTGPPQSNSKPPIGGTYSSLSSIIRNFLTVFLCLRRCFTTFSPLRISAPSKLMLGSLGLGLFPLAIWADRCRFGFNKRHFCKHTAVLANIYVFFNVLDYLFVKVCMSSVYVIMKKLLQAFMTGAYRHWRPTNKTHNYKHTRNATGNGMGTFHCGQYALTLGKRGGLLLHSLSWAREDLFITIYLYLVFVLNC